MKTITIRIKRQRSDHCGPYALEAVLRFYGDKISPAALSRLCRTNRHGTSPENLAAAARARGFTVKTKEWAEINDLIKELRRGFPPIVLWFSENEGHYSVIVGADRQFITLADPELGKNRKLSRSVFRRVWFDFSTSGPERHSRLYARWMMTIKPKKAS